MSGLKQQLSDDMKAAMKAKDKQRLGVVRLALAAIKQVEVDERIELDDARVLAVLGKMIKQRRDSISQYEDANRQDLADQEKYEVDVLQTYLPAEMDESELDTLISSIVSAVGASSMQDMGKVMNELRPKVQGRADMGVVSQKVKAALSS